MNKKLFGLIFAGVFLMLLSMSISSAYYYNYGSRDGYYDAVSYSKTRVSGYYGQPSYARTTDYDKVTSKYWDGRRYVTRTSYVKTTSETPRYDYYSNYYNYPKTYYRYNYPPTNYYGGYMPMQGYGGYWY